MKAVLFILALALIVYTTALPVFHPDEKAPGFFHYNSSSGDCEANITCADEGDDCSTNCSITDGNCCAAGLFCYQSECASDNLGDSCKSSADCFSQYTGAQTNCVDGECALQYYANDECDDNSDCLSGNCTDDLCTGGLEGTNCTYSYDCAYGFSCSPSGYNGEFVCTPLTPGGGDCSTTNCYFGYTCVNDKCIGVYSVEEGDDCTPNSDDECQGGLVCPANGKCTQGNQWEQTECDSDSDCPKGQFCFCSEYSGETLCVGLIANMSVGDSFTDLYECVRDHNCTRLSNAPDSCVQENCDSDYSDSTDSTCEQSEALFDSCFESVDCGGFPVWAIIVIAVVAVILVLVIIVVAVMCMKRKRNDYDSI